MYIGHGSKGRAWTCGHVNLPIRSPKHLEWIESLLNQGRAPDEFVRIRVRSLTKEDARAIEKEMIHKEKPVFNISIQSKQLKFTPDIYRKALSFREQGFSYKTIGKLVGLSTMVVHRGLNKMPISLEYALESE